MADRRVQVDIDGNAGGIIAAMAQAENAVQTQTRMISGHFSELSGSVNKVIGLVGTMSAVLAGGAAFKSFVDASQQWTGETLKLAKALGTSTEEAGAWKVAAHGLGIEQDVLENTSMKLSRSVATNQGAFDKLGIQIKDTHTGALLPMTQIIQNTAERLNEMEPGVNRNAAASTLFGKSWKDNMGILKLTSEAVAEGKKELQDLGLEVGPERVRQFLQYRTEMKYVGLVAESLKVQVGNALLPALISMGQWFKDVAPVGLTVFGGALKGVITFIEYATLGVETLWETWKALWNQFSSTSISLVQIVTQIVRGDFAGAWQTAKKGVADFGAYGVQWFDNVAAASQRTNERVAKLWGLTAQTAAKSVPQPRGEQFDGTKDKDKDLSGKQIAAEDARFKAILAGFKAREQAIQQGNQSLILDEDFYYQTGLIGQTQFNDEKYEIQRKGLINTQALLDDEIKAIKAAEAKKLALADTAEMTAKVKADSQRQVTEKLAEKQKLNAELYQLDAKYFMDTRVLALNREWEERNAAATWAQERRNADQAERQQTASFYAMQAEMSGNSFLTEKARLEQEKQSWLQGWAMMTDSFEEHERRKLQIEQVYSEKRKRVEQDESRAKLNVYSNTFGSMASIADSFNKLMGGKNKAAFRAYQAFQSGQTIISTASGIMQAWSDPSSVTWYEKAAHAAAVGLAGAVQLANIWSASPDGGSSSSSSGSSSDSSGGSLSYSATSQVPTQPVNQQQIQQGHLTVNITGDMYGVDKAQVAKWYEETLIPIANEAGSRGVTINVGK